MKKPTIVIIVLFITRSCLYANTLQDTTPWNLACGIFHREYGFLCGHAAKDQLTAIYDIQTFLNPLLVRAEREQAWGLVDSMAGVVLAGTGTLREVRWYPLNNFRGTDSVDLGRFYRMWLYPKTLNLKDTTLQVREEYHLSSSQFLFLAAQVLRIGASLPAGRYPKLDSLMEVFPSILLEHHYKRWIMETRSFRLSGWGCAKGTYNHREFLRLKQDRGFRFKPVVCKTIFDSDLMIMAGLAQVLTAHAIDPARVPVSAGDLAAYREYLREAEAIVQSRIELRPIALAGNTLQGFAFDNELYRDYADHRYALYTDTLYPPEGMKEMRSPDAAWDISHARRFFFVFNAMHQASGTVPLTLPYPQYLEALGHQFYHVVYTDTVRMLFSNYLNGENGWYRVGYHGKGSGSPPYSLSQSALEGGWFFLSEYYPPVGELGQKLWKQFREDPEVYNRYYGVIYRNYQPVYRNFSTSPSGSERFVLLQWLPGILEM
ncbi:MAG TPA: hypothetical protein P5228_06670 [Bacteroidales bacterium]|nr:hypothetical protein [Bacteroidales bacterium]HRZ48208.1 hypothetical protein [Bacteroidales bacterium]